MYHYLGNLQWHESCGYSCFSSMQVLCKIADRWFFGRLDLVDRERLNPGESGEVQVKFLRIDLVSQLIQVGSHVRIHGHQGVQSSLQSISGEILITQDPWINCSEWISVGDVRRAEVGEIKWTTAAIVLEGEIESCLMSQDMGLKEWEEIGQVLNHGDIVKVRVEKVDEVSRKIKVSFVEKVLCQNVSQVPHQLK
jgi:ribosomal protein S1